MRYCFRILLPFIFLGCATIQKDIYFKNFNQHAGKVFEDGPTPGARIEFKNEFKDGYSLTNVSVRNMSNGIYLFGIVVPILPVFFLGNSTFELDKNEKLSIFCTTTFFSKHPDRTYRYVKSGPCRYLQVTTPTQVLIPQNIDSFGIFTFNIKVAELDRLIISGITIDDGFGGARKINDKLVMKREDKTHYHIPRVN